MKKKEVYERTLRLSGEGTYNLIEQAETIATRENMSLNTLQRKALEEFVQRHGKGNNSFPLDKYGVTWTKAKPVTKCCFKDCGKPAVGIGLRTDINQTIGFCSKHFVLCNDPKMKPVNSKGAALYVDMKWIDTIGDLKQ